MRLRGYALAFLGAAMFGPTAANAYCVGADTLLPDYQPDYYAVPKEFARAIFVVEATVTKEIWIGYDGKPKSLTAPWGLGKKRPWGVAAPYMGAWYDVQVARSFKGQPPKHLRLFSENSTGRFWLTKGQSYLLFVGEDPFDQPIGRAMTIDACGNSTTLKGNSKLLRQLAVLVAPHS